MGEYTAWASFGAAAVVLAEVAVFRTGLFRTGAYWIAMAIVFSFQVLVDGWLTKLSAPIVRYNPDELSGRRFPWDVPVEDYLFGFAMVTLTMVLWDWGGRRRTLRGDGDG
ncbi:MAG TPA: lycopene cyclase domain-containing protein [Acidimicrobiales bacterium]|nr:lycopene cyclase domain-containing protein [Acidimicrobiales bacterium]